MWRAGVRVYLSAPEALKQPILSLLAFLVLTTKPRFLQSRLESCSQGSSPASQGSNPASQGSSPAKYSYADMVHSRQSTQHWVFGYCRLNSHSISKS